MRKCFTMILMVFFLAGASFAQQVEISGTITGSDDNQPLAGVNVVVSGTNNGTITDLDGNFVLQANVGDELTISYIGYKTQNLIVGNQTSLSIILEVDITALDEVVVTALGVSRDKKSLGYSVGKVSTDEIAAKDAVSITNSLQGRVAGVQISSGQGTIGGSTRVLIRGVNSLSGSSQPLYVVDGVPISNYNVSGSTSGYDFGNGAQDINPDDVANISVLKGAAATAIYGSRGANGVILITTKSGREKKGIGIELNSTVTFDSPYILPNFQNQYGGGRSADTGYDSNTDFVAFDTFDYAASGLGSEWASFDGTAVVNTGRDESWGPRLDGQDVLHWDSFVPESPNYLKTRPFSPNPDNYKDIFAKGLTLSNSVAFSGSDEKSSFRVGFTNINQQGIVPNSELKKNTINLRTSTKVHDKVEVFANVNYVNQETVGRSRFGYSGSGLSVPGAMRIWTQRQVDSELHKLYYSDALGQQVGWNLRDISDGRLYIRWSNNPYWVLNNIFAEDAKSRTYGNVGTNIEIMDGLMLSLTGRTDRYSLDANSRIGTGGTTDDYYGISKRDQFENNFEAMLKYNGSINEDISLSAFAGTNFMHVKYNSAASGTVDGLVIDNFFNISNSESPADVSQYTSERKINSLFASASFGYKEMLFLDLTGRNDWSSTLPVEERSYFYPSASASFLFSELLADQTILSFGKLRIGMAQVGNSAGAYSLQDVYNITSFGPVTTFTVSDVSNNANLKDELTKEFEVGVEASFLQGLVGIEATYYNKKAINHIISLDVSNTSGASRSLTNVGEMEISGFEGMLFATPVKTNDLSWDISFNIGTNKTMLNELVPGTDEYLISSAGSAWVTADVGGEYGVLQAYDGYTYDDNGNKLVDGSGYYIRAGEPVKLGSILPDYTGGVMNTLKFKGVTFGALVDFQKGGLVYSWANRWATASGQTAMTVGTNDLGNPYRMDPAQGGGVVSEGVYSDGTPNDIHLDARNYFRQLRNLPENFVYDASFVKLRELRLGYDLPTSLVQSIKLNGASISFVARNVALLHSNTDGFDPEQVNSISMGSAGYEGGSLPSTRSLGFNLNLKF